MLNILVKNVTAATRIMESSSNEKTTLVSNNPLYKQAKPTTNSL